MKARDLEELNAVQGRLLRRARGATQRGLHRLADAADLSLWVRAFPVATLAGTLATAALVTRSLASSNGSEGHGGHGGNGAPARSPPGSEEAANSAASHRALVSTAMAFVASAAARRLTRAVAAAWTEDSPDAVAE